MFTLAGGRFNYPFDDALATVLEYAFAEDSRLLAPGEDRPGVFDPHPVPKFAYRSYDCVPASPGRALTDLDLLVGAGLNAFAGGDGIDAQLVYALRSFGRRAAGHLDNAYRMEPDFLNLSDAELASSPQEPGSAGWHLYQAWLQGVATPGLRTARVHKVLHHKRPTLFPLLDNKTIDPIREAAREEAERTKKACNSWQLIQREILRQREAFDRLALEFAGQATGVDDVPLSHLRLYDILLWMAVTNQRPGTRS